MDDLRTDVVLITPHDGFTNTQSTYPTILVADRRAEIPEDERAVWIGACRLAQLPVDITVPLVSHYVAPDPNRPDDHIHRFEFAPVRELAASWYQFSVDFTSMPGVRAQEGVPEPTSRVFAVRFRPDPHPIVTSVSVDDEILEVQLSERLFVSSDDVAIRLNGSRIACEIETSFVLGQPDYGAELAPPDVEAPQSLLRLACGRQLAGAIGVTFRESAHALGGAPVYDATDRPFGETIATFDTTEPAIERRSLQQFDVPIAFAR